MKSSVLRSQFRSLMEPDQVEMVTALIQLVDEEALSFDDVINAYVDDVPNDDKVPPRYLALMSSGVGTTPVRYRL